MRRRALSLVAAIVVMAGVAGCGSFVSEDSVARAAEKQGYRDVHITSKHIFFVNWRGCGKDDDAELDATGINSNGQRVELVLCAGWPFKGVTVRTK